MIEGERRPSPWLAVALLPKQRADYERGPVEVDHVRNHHRGQEYVSQLHRHEELRVQLDDVDDHEQVHHDPRYQEQEEEREGSGDHDDVRLMHQPDVPKQPATVEQRGRHLGREHDEVDPHVYWELLKPHPQDADDGEHEVVDQHHAVAVDPPRPNQVPRVVNDVGQHHGHHAENHPRVILPHRLNERDLGRQLPVPPNNTPSQVAGKKQRR